MEPKVFIILLNYKAANDTIEAIESLEGINYKNFEIIVVDNLSNDGSFEEIKKNTLGNHIFIQSGANKGFAYGNNIGIDYAMKNGGDYVLLLNNDTTVEKDFLNQLVAVAEGNKDTGLVTGKILNYYNKEIVWYGGGEINWKRFYGYHYEDNRIGDISEITFATGCLMLISKEAIKSVGKLPEEYFMYYEDVHYCAKLRDKGFKILYNPKSVIYHKISASSGGEESPFSIEWNTRNRLRFMKNFKDKSKFNYYKGKIFFYSTRIIKLLNYRIKGKKEISRALIKALK